MSKMFDKLINVTIVLDCLSLHVADARHVSDVSCFPTVTLH